MWDGRRLGRGERKIRRRGEKEEWGLVKLVMWIWGGVMVVDRLGS